VKVTGGVDSEICFRQQEITGRKGERGKEKKARENLIGKTKPGPELKGSAFHGADWEKRK